MLKFGFSGNGTSFKSRGFRSGNLISLSWSFNDGSEVGCDSGFDSGIISGEGCDSGLSSAFLMDGKVNDGHISESYSYWTLTRYGLGCSVLLSKTKVPTSSLPCLLKIG